MKDTRTEIVIGLVGAVGTNLEPVCHALAVALKEVGYRQEVIRLSELLRDVQVNFENELVETPYEARLNSYMSGGNQWRRETKRGDVMALAAVAKIRQRREEKNGQEDEPMTECALVLRSLKNEKEIETLRDIYGSTFFLLSAYAPRQKRVETLASQIAASHNSFRVEEYEGQAISLVNRDEAEEGDSFGQQVRKTFWRGDAFVDASDISHLASAIQRIVHLWFGHPFHTPTRDEYLMFSAQAAALRSASLGRQVGAVIATQDGSIIATGANEVPKPGGGIYWHEDEQDARDHVLGQDSSDVMRREVLGDIVQRLKEAEGTPWLAEDKRNLSVVTLVKLLMEGDKNNVAIMKGAEFTNLTEYQRPVHAEMTALTDAARRGIQTQGCTLFTTTFPCHGCARHIVASGIMRVVYIEPYAKSLARNLHADAIRIEDNLCVDHRVCFEPFVGIAPRRYMEFFAMKKRKENDGSALKWRAMEAVPLLNGWSHFLTAYNEGVTLAEFSEELTNYNRE